MCIWLSFIFKNNVLPSNYSRYQIPKYRVMPLVYSFEPNHCFNCEQQMFFSGFYKIPPEKICTFGVSYADIYWNKRLNHHLCVHHHIESYCQARWKCPLMKNYCLQSHMIKQFMLRLTRIQLQSWNLVSQNCSIKALCTVSFKLCVKRAPANNLRVPPLTADVCAPVTFNLQFHARPVGDDKAPLCSTNTTRWRRSSRQGESLSLPADSLNNHLVP